MEKVGTEKGETEKRKGQERKKNIQEMKTRKKK